MASKYNIVVKAVLNKADLYKQVKQLEDKIKQKPIDIAVKADPLSKASKNANNLANGLGKVNANGIKTGNVFGKIAGGIAIAIDKMLLWKIAGDIVFGTFKKVQESMAFIEELNAELVKLQFVTGQSEEEVYKVADAYNGLAASMRVSTLEVSKGALEWMRQGKTAQEAIELTRQSVYLSKLGNLEAAEATEYLTSTLNGFKLGAQDASSVVDKLIVLDNNYSTSAGEIALALQKSANTAQLAGVDFDRLASYITIVSSVTRKSAESIGNSFKTVFTRMYDVKLNKNVDEMGESISDVEKVLKRFGIQTRDEMLQFRNAGDILDEVASKWKNFNNIDKAVIAKALGGTWQRENVLTLLENYDKLGTMLDQQATSQGLAQERMKNYLDSIEGQQARMQTAWDAIWASESWMNFVKDWYKFWGDFNIMVGRGMGAATGDEETLKDFEKRIEDQKALIASMKAMPTEARDDQAIFQQEDALKIWQEEYDKLAVKLGVAADGQKYLASSAQEAKDMEDALGTAADNAAASIEAQAQANDIAIENATKTAESISGTDDSLRKLIDSYSASTGATVDQISALQQLFPEQYNQALVLDQQTGLMTINMSAVRQLTTEKINAMIKELEYAVSLDTTNQKLQDALILMKSFGVSVQSNTYWLPKMGAAASSAAKQVSDNEKAYKDLVEMTVKMLKDKANAEKDALKDELDGYKDIIDAQKKILDQQEEERKYKDEMAEKNKELSDIENELLEIQFDNSEWAEKRRKELTAERVKKQKEIEDKQTDHSVDKQKDALDQEYDDYKKYIDAKIKELDNYLDQSGSLTQEAMDLLSEKSSAFYQELIEWNRKFGTGVDTDVTGKWQTAFNSIITYSGGAAGALANVVSGANNATAALQKMDDLLKSVAKASKDEEKDILDALYGGSSPSYDPYAGGSPFDAIPSHHSGGIVGGVPTIKESEQLVKLLKGEPVLSIPQTKNLMNNIIPNLMASGGGGDSNVNLVFNVTGSIDKDIMPQFEKKVLDTINKAMKKRGFRSGVTSYSV